MRGFEDDPLDDPTTDLPSHLVRTALDIHCHVLGVGTGGTGCTMHPRMRSSIQVRAGLWNYRLSLGQPDLDQAYISYLLSRSRSAGFLKQIVLLAMDAFCDSDGRRDLNRTPFFTPNDYIARLAEEHPEFLFGASVHPYRRNALAELDRVAALGAVLVKWIPNVQGIDLTDAQCRAFYRRLAALHMPLLVHVGYEGAVFVVSQELGDPRRLTAPLEEGVTVIAAHAACAGQTDGRDNFDWLLEMFPRWPNLYADTSALTLLTRTHCLPRLIEHPEIFPRLIHGSDFPLPPTATLFLGRMPLGSWWHTWLLENPLRRDFEIKRALGLPDDVLTRGYTVLAPRLRALRPAAPSQSTPPRTAIEYNARP